MYDVRHDHDFLTDADVGIQSHFPNQITITHQNDWVFMIDKSLFLIVIMIVIAAIIANHATNLEMCFFTIPGYKQFLNFSAAAAPGSLSVVTLQVNLAINMFLCSGREFFVIYTDETTLN